MKNQKKKNHIFIKFWGVRGSIPRPGKDFIKYGGNTPCVEVRCGNTILIFDAGTGIMDLGLSLTKEYKKIPDINLFISHTHWDHIQGFPFFNFLFMKGAKINIYGGHLHIDIKTLLSGQMKREYFPVLLNEVPAVLNFPTMNTNPIKIKDVEIYHTHLLHPALSLGFRIKYKKKIIVYATDNELINNELLPDYNASNLEFLIKDADILIAESQYTEDEYKTRIGWGHSSIERLIQLCLRYNIKNLYIFHHDPYHTDQFIDQMIAKGKKMAGKSLKIFGAREGMEIILD